MKILMTAVLEKIEKSEAFFEFEIDAKVFDKGLDKAYKKRVKTLDVPGFRKGTAPRKVVEANFGLEVLLEDAMEMVVPDAYYAAVKVLNLNTVGEPDIEVGHVVSGQPVKVKVMVPVAPEVILGRTEGLEVTVPPLNTVSDTDVDRFLQKMVAENKIVSAKPDSPAVQGDTVTFDYKGLLGGDVFESQENFKVVIGADSFISGFEEQLIGAKQGDNLEVKISFAQDHPAKPLAGKTAQFMVKVKKVELVQPRPLNDRFAQEVAKLSNLEELCLEARKQLQEMSKLVMQENKKKAVVAAALAQCDFDVPEYLVIKQAGFMLEEFSNQLAGEGGSLDLYLQMTGSNKEILKSRMWQDAKIVVRSNFMLDKILKEKGFTITDKELNGAITQFATNFGMEVENAREKLGPMVDKIAYDLKIEKTIQYMVDHAAITISETASAAQA